MSLSWTQPCCAECYEREFGRPAVALLVTSEETCVYCGNATEDGIFIRIDPAEAPFPTRTK